MLEKLEQCQKVTVVGLGLTGFACAQYLSGLNRSFQFVDTRDEPPEVEKFKTAFPSVDYFFGQQTEDYVFGEGDLLIVSPGVAVSHPLVVDALTRGAQITSDIELFKAEIEGPVIAVTGSNGKSTVVSLIAYMLRAAGKKVVLAGNIGVPVLQTLSDARAADVIVLELSSFQLERLDALNADVACVLNISEDHMDRYATLNDYQEAKLAIYQGAQTAVFNHNDDMTWPAGFSGNTYTFGEVAEFSINDGMLCYQDKPLLSSKKLRIKGSHNELNVLAAFACCFSFGVALDNLCLSVQTFEGIKHRCQWLGNIDGVDYYNDSKGTNVGATFAAIDGLATNKNIILIAGGQDKNSDFSVLSKAVEQHVKQLILIGDCAEKMAAELKTKAYFSTSLESAVALAHDIAERQDLVLLSPACASFDMFDNYAQRGDVFIAQVKKLQEVAA